MANTFTGMTHTNIAQRMLSALVKALIPLSGFTRDYSDEVSAQGEAFTINMVGDPGAAGSLSGTHSGSRITAGSADTSTTPKNGTMDQDPVSGFHLTDREAASLADGVVSQLVQRKFDLHARSVAKHVLDYVFNLLTFANVGEGTNVGAATGFTFDNLSLLKATLLDAGWSEEEITVALQPVYAAYLEIDNSDAFKNKFVFPIVKAPTLPVAGSTPATENLIGFAATPDSIGIATRVVEPQSMQGIEHFEIVQDPVTGLAIGYRATAYDGVVYHTMDLLYGAIVADGARVHPLRSAESGN